MNAIMEYSVDLPTEFSTIASILQLDAQLLGDYSVRAVNGRQLQEALGNSQKHTDWAKYQISKLHLKQGVDYEILSNLSFTNTGSTKSRQQLVQTFCFPIEVAKSIAMVSQSPNGGKVRSYFLHMEKVAQEAYRGDKLGYVQATLTAKQKAYRDWQDETTIINDVLSKLGYSQGYLRKEALEIGFRIEGETGEHFLPNALVNDPQAVDPQQLSEHTGTHAALVGIGTQGYSASNIAQIYGKDISPTDINNILVSRGYQTKYDRKGKYKPTEKGRIFCNQSTLASGPHKGKLAIKEWLYNTNKALRDEIDDGVEKLRISRKK